jgi:hypothetical protein
VAIAESVQPEMVLFTMGEASVKSRWFLPKGRS